MLAMVVNDDTGFLDECGACEPIAGKPAPTEKRIGTGFPLFLICLPIKPEAERRYCAVGKPARMPV
ncbi:hypothetical protein FQ186_10185 [Pseudomonas sp. ANT_H14]|nr:hypothetical protein FQ182_27980 [Pseudomonas sp. ANT_H4]KAA0952702.1 hypothetical protein FQ186_10185 [Pseudomonas sp. ANT_H14]